MTSSRHQLSKRAALAVADELALSETSTSTSSSTEAGFLRRYFSFLVGEGLSVEDRQFAMDFDGDVDSGFNVDVDFGIDGDKRARAEQGRRFFGLTLGLAAIVLAVLWIFLQALAPSSSRALSAELSEREVEPKVITSTERLDFEDQKLGESDLT
ncbi:MAG: hypothetical protein V3W41_09670 [Planctomycetota bacterium]